MPLFWLKEGEVSPYAAEVPDLESAPPRVDSPGPAGLGRLQEAYARYAEPAGRTAALTVEERRATPSTIQTSPNPASPSSPETLAALPRHPCPGPVPTSA